MDDHPHENFGEDSADSETVQESEIELSHRKIEDRYHRACECYDDCTEWCQT